MSQKETPSNHDVDIIQIIHGHIPSSPIPVDVDGITTNERGFPIFHEWKHKAIQAVVPKIEHLMKMRKTDDFIAPYRADKSLPARFVDVLRRDSAKTHYNDHAKYFGSFTFADLLVAAIVNEGKIPARGTMHNTLTVTSNAIEAAGIAEKHTDTGIDESGHIKFPKVHTEYLKTVLRAIYTLELPNRDDKTFQGQVASSYLFSPVVLRLKDLPRNRIDHALDKTVVSPYLTFDDITPECLDHINQVSGIDLLALRDYALNRTQELKASSTPNK